VGCGRAARRAGPCAVWRALGLAMACACHSCRRGGAHAPFAHLAHTHTHTHTHTCAHAGPGHYWVEGGLPSMGTLPSYQASSSSSPSRNPRLRSSSFVSTVRPVVFKPREGPSPYLRVDEVRLQVLPGRWDLPCCRAPVHTYWPRRGQVACCKGCAEHWSSRVA